MKKTIMLFLLAAVMVAGVVYVEVTEDKTSPEISFPSTDVTYNYLEDKDTYLDGVTALDDVDGDVSSKIKIDSITPLKNLEEVVITYVVRDEKNNFASMQRVLSMDEVTKAYYQENIIITPTEEPTPTPEPMDDFTEYTGYTEELTPTEGPSPTPYPLGAPVIELSTHEIELPIGGTFNYSDYIVEISDDRDDKFELARHINLVGDYNTNIPGTYEVLYRIMDSDGNYSNDDAKITITVK